MRYGYGANRDRGNIILDNFRGYNSVDEPSSLAAGYLVTGSQNIDISRSRGGLPKVLGRASLFTSLGAGGIKGMHNYRNSSGDIPLFGWDKALYKLSGTEHTEAVSSTAEFDGGTYTNADGANNQAKVAGVGAVTNTVTEILAQAGGWSATTVNELYEKTLAVAGKDFTVRALFYPRSHFSTSTRYNERINFLDSSNNVIAYLSIADLSNSGYARVTSLVIGGVTAYTSSVATSGWLELSRTGTTWALKVGGVTASSGPATATEISKIQYEIVEFTPIVFCSIDLFTAASMGNDGAWTSPIYDFTVAPKTATIAFDIMAAPETAPTLSAVTEETDSMPTGVYYGKVTFVDTYGAESEASAASAALTVPSSGKIIQWSNIPTGGTGIVARRLYRTNGTGTTYYYLATISDNTATTFNDRAIQSPPFNCLGKELIEAGPVEVKIGVSTDGVNFGDWKTIAETGDAIPRKRYARVAVEIPSNGVGSNALNDFTITYTLAHDTATSIKTGLTGNRIRFCDYGGLCYFSEGGKPQRYDGTDITELGVTPPATSPTIAASGSAGNPNGTYKALVTFVNKYSAESNGGAESAAVTVTSSSINWTNIPVGSTGIEKRNLYRTKAGGSLFFYVGTIDDNTTTTYSDDLADANLLTPLPTDNGIPPECDIVYEHKNYMMYVTDNLLYYSKPAQPDSVPDNNYKEFPADITGIKTYQDYLAVEGNTFSAIVSGDIWGDDPVNEDNTVVQIINKSAGAVNHEAMAECYGSGVSDIILYPSMDGMTYLDLGVQDQSVRAALLSQEVQNIFDGAVDRENMAAVYHNYLYMLAMCYYGADDTPVGYNNIIMAYDLQRKCWYPPITYGVSCFCKVDNMLLAGDSVNGIIYQMNTGATDNGENIKTVALTSVMAPQNRTAKTKFTRLRYKVGQGSVTDTIEMAAYVDGYSGDIDLVASDIWEQPTVSPYHKIPRPRGYELQLKIEDDSKNDWIISSINIEYEGGN